MNLPNVTYNHTLSELYTNGMKIMSDPFILPRTEWQQVRFPKSKKKRIRKKWSKLNKNYKIFEVDVYIIWGNIVLVNPKNYAQLIEQVTTS